MDPWFNLTTEDRHDPPGEETVVADQGPPAPAPARAAGPSRRYRAVRLVGQGGFGLVYEVHDEQLNRRVAMKVPHPHLLASRTDAELYLAEARMVAQLDHPGIVPVYDVGSTPEYPCFVVSKLIDGDNLAVLIRQTRYTPPEAAELVASVAEALHHAHGKGLVHRDVKPSNILIDRTGRPYVVDFGLALRDQDPGKASRHAGTPAYMSPEQAWGEGHRVDGRSDVFSLAVVFYELLTRRRPFRGGDREALLEQVKQHDPRPPGQLDESIPQELERICLKALSKRASERYPTAGDMAEDLRLFLEEEARRSEQGKADSPAPAPPLSPTTTPPPASRDSLPMSLLPLNIVPRGLRSFDSRDSDFFLGLIPGPRDRDGLPESLRFWKHWIESEADRTYPVGLIFGPSGCGKSSLVKAGLLPLLSRDIIKVYVEATPRETEARLLNNLRKRIPALDEKLDLRDSLATLRQGRVLPDGKKVLIVLDQFEQWLHAHREEEAPHLVRALRQCDGDHVCCIAMVRDDFWMAASRFMKAIEVHIEEGRNSTPVDLFDTAHAVRVLAAFGQAYGHISAGPARRQKEQVAFLKEAVAGLAQDGKVVCVRLALFAEMMKSKPWTRSALAGVGGTRGVGFAFLEANFGDAAATPEHRYHRKAARAVLAALLPEPGADIKGHMRSLADLLEVSGYAARPQDFEDLLRILDLELRLISPTDPEGTGVESQEAMPAPGSEARPGGRHYQLTHDYLVHSLRDWLTHKKGETATGRAELCLEDRARLWDARPEDRFLPSFSEWIRIHTFTRTSTRTAPQRAMMRRADFRYAAIGALFLALAMAMTWGGLEAVGRIRAGELVGSLSTSATSQHPALKARFATIRRWARPQLQEILRTASPSSQEYLHASLLLAEEDPSRVDYLCDRLLSASPAEVPVLREALSPYATDVIPRLHSTIEASRPGDEALLPAAAAMAAYLPQDATWGTAAEKLARGLLITNPASIGLWIDEFRPIAPRLAVPIQNLFHDRGLPESERLLAATILASYSADPPLQLANLLMDAEARSFAILFAAARRQEDRIVPILEGELARKPAVGDKADKRSRLAARQARAAIALYLFGRHEEVLSRLRHSPDPELRSNLIIGLRPTGADPRPLIAAASRQAAGAGPVATSAEAATLDPAASTRRALILALGHYDRAELGEEGEGFVERLATIYREDLDPGIHGAAEWTLRRWGLGDRVNAIDGELGKAKDPPGRGWTVNSQGQTLAMIRGPVEFMMGSPLDECRHQTFDLVHRRRIPRSFAIGLKEVSVAEFQRFLAEKPEVYPKLDPAYAPEIDGPMSGVSWYDAAAYCNWLSRKEGLREYYRPNAEGRFGPGMKVGGGAEACNGYRLPTEAEWEFAGRAGAATSRYYGSSDDLLTLYAWGNITSDGHAWPCGRLLPNDLGLFDTLGNVYEWCENRNPDLHAGPQEELTVDQLDPDETLDMNEDRMIRGGGFVDVKRDLRTPQRHWNRVNNQLGSYGFRIARTLVPPTPPVAGR